MRYYKEIDLDNLDVIIEKCLAYVKREETLSHAWNKLNEKALFNACPELQLSFSKYDLICNYAAVVMVGPGSFPPPHVDGKQFASARINLPLMNCKGTRTEFFSNVRIEPSDAYGLSYYIVTNTDYVLEDSFELSKATVMRVKEPHRVAVPLNGYRRLSLTLGFDKDPIFLLED